jgi:ABC-2 type transport system permease protein
MKSSLTHIIMKEVKELLTPATLIPIIIFAIIFGSLGSAFGGATSQLSEPPKLGVINQDPSAIGDFVYHDLESRSTIVYNGTDVQAGIQAVTDQNGAALIVITSSFSSNITQNASGVVQIYWIMKGTGFLDQISSATADSVLAQVQKDLSKALIDSHAPIDSAVILNPINATQNTVFKGKEMIGISPVTIGTVMAGQSIIVPLIVVMVVIYAGTMVVTSMGSEKENKTLETLLTLPVRRSSIVFGKLAGAAIVGLVFAAIYMIGMGYYMTSLTGSSSIDLSKYGISLSLVDYVLVGISLFLALLFALGLCMILGIFTKNYRAAQTMTLPVTMLALIPMFVLMFTDFNSLPLAAQVLVFAIPFSQPIIAMNSLMFGQVTIVLVGIAYEIVIALVTIFIAVYLFKKDILLTGRVRSAEAKKRGSYSLWTMIKKK